MCAALEISHHVFILIDLKSIILITWRELHADLKATVRHWSAVALDQVAAAAAHTAQRFGHFGIRTVFFPPFTSLFISLILTRRIPLCLFS